MHAPRSSPRYLVYALALGVVASAVAIPLAAYGGRAYARFAATMLNFDIAGYAIPRSVILLQLIAGLFLPLLSAAIPVWRGSRIAVASALRDAGIGGETAPWIQRIHGTHRPLLFSLRNAFRRRWRTGLTLVTLASGGAAFLAALDLRASIRDSVGVIYDDMLRFDMSVRVDGPHDADSLGAIVSNIPGVERAELWSGVRATQADAGDLAVPFSLTAVPPDVRLIAMPLLSGRVLRDAGGPEIVVNTRMAEE